jgi:hypothetical protein
MIFDTIHEEYEFYLEHCVDEEKGEIPLLFDEFKREFKNQ